MDKIRIGFIGCGIRTMLIMQEMMKRDEFEIVAVSDISQQSIDMVCTKFEINWERYLDYKELLKREDIQAVIIASPDYVHEEQCIAAFEAGKHVFLEKPIATTVEGGRRVLQKRDETGKALIIGFVLRYNRAFQRMKEFIDSGIIGEIKTGWVLHSVGNGSDWYFHDWHGIMKNTGGLLLQKGSHDFDIINWVTGAKVKKIAAFGSRDWFGGDKPDDLVCQKCEDKNTCTEANMDLHLTLNKPDGTPFDFVHNKWRIKCAFRQEIDVLDNHQVLLEYENGIKVSYMECHYTPDDNREFRFFGTKGKINLDCLTDTITIQLRHGTHDRSEIMTIKNLQSEAGHGGGDQFILDDFINAIRKGKKPIASGEDGLESIKIGIVAHEAIKQGKVISC